MASDKVDPLEPKELGTLIVVVGKAVRHGYLSPMHRILIDGGQGKEPRLMS